MATLSRNKKLAPYGASILYRTLGPSLPEGSAAAAFVLPLAINFAGQHASAVHRAGHSGNRVTLGANLFHAILQSRSGLIFSQHLYEDIWSLIKNPDQRIYLEIPEMLEEWKALAHEHDPAADYPFVLMAGERRSYNANQIYRSPAWRKIDAEGSMRMHPTDAQSLNISEGTRVICESALNRIEAVVTIDDSVRCGVVTLPHGYGMRYKESEPLGPALNRLTSRQHCDALTRTPFHKYVPVRIRKADATAAA